MSIAPKVAVVYYSATGTVHQLAKHVVSGAREAGAEVRLLRVGELAPAEVIATAPAWEAHVAATRDVPIASAAYQGKRVATVAAQLLAGRAISVS